MPCVPVQPSLRDRLHCIFLVRYRLDLLVPYLMFCVAPHTHFRIRSRSPPSVFLAVSLQRGWLSSAESAVVSPLLCLFGFTGILLSYNQPLYFFQCLHAVPTRFVVCFHRRPNRRLDINSVQGIWTGSSPVSIFTGVLFRGRFVRMRNP